ncbi:MAG: hypothetical protein DSZ23_06200 [Thermodesulfatator sp.]|nr:MAG: hypothetical protein DSZ23_06200 [Thermodesulfatator sp.]
MAEAGKFKELDVLLNKWKDTEAKTKKAFLRLKEFLERLPEVILSFKSRPGVSHSLRGTHKNQKDKSLFVMVDIIDDNPENRWLSVCFYGDMIKDPDERGDFVPGGLLGEDACCFDIETWDEELLLYVEKRISEAHEAASRG